MRDIMLLQDMNNVVEIVKSKLSECGKDNALFYRGKFYSYERIWKDAYKVASGLLSYDVHKIAIFSERNYDAIIAILACLITGKIFIPLNTNNPNASNKKLCELVRPDCILYSDVTHLQKGFARSYRGFDIAMLMQDKVDMVEDCFKAVVNNDIATILFTSGSTGIPKPIPISHKNILTYVSNITSRFSFNKNDNFLQITEINFDPMLHDLFVCWAVGGCIYLFPDQFIAGLGRFLNKYNISVWTSVPSTARLMLKVGNVNDGALTSLKWTIFGGENLPYELCQLWHSIAPNSNIINTYGPTEATVGVTSHLLDVDCYDLWLQEGNCPIGRTYDRVDIILMDLDKIVCDVGQIGECWIGGDQVVSGYYQQQEITKQRFIRWHGKYWYKTGDLMKIGEDGDLIFVGRSDSQIKNRGYRVELQEVENILRQSAKTLSSAVIYVPEKTYDGKCIEPSLVAFVDNNSVTNEEIFKRCHTLAPHYMIPDKIFRIEELPCNVNGKVDYMALKERYKSCLE